MPATAQATVVIANLATLERHFALFEAECWNAARTTLVAGPLTAQGVWLAAAATWVQKNPIWFRGLVKGTTYSFRSRVRLQAGGPPSAWSAWADETAGDVIAPNPSYSAVATLSAGGVLVKANPTGAPSDLHHYDFYWNLTGTPPLSTTRPNAPPNSDATIWLVLGDADIASIWIRAVDTSGNVQAWTALGSVNSKGQLIAGPSPTPGGYNLDFELTTQAVDSEAAGWLSEIGTGGSVGYETATPISGTRSGRVTGTTGNATGLRNRRFFQVEAGNRFHLKATARCSVAGVVGHVRLSWYNGAGAEIGVSAIAWTETTNTSKALILIAVSNAVKARVEFFYHDSSTANGSFIVDDIYPRRFIPSRLPVVGELWGDGGYLEYLDGRGGGVPALFGSGISAVGVVNIQRNALNRYFLTSSGHGRDGTPASGFHDFGQLHTLQGSGLVAFGANDTQVGGIQAEMIAGTPVGQASIARAFTNRVGINVTGTGINRTPTTAVLEAQNGIRSGYGTGFQEAYRAINLATGGQDFALETDGTEFNISRAGVERVVRVPNSVSRVGVRVAPTHALHVSGVSARIESTGSASWEVQDLDASGVRASFVSDGTVYKLNRPTVADDVTLNATGVGVRRTPANLFEAQGDIISRGSGAALWTERRESLGNIIALYSDAGAIRLWDGTSGADRAAFDRANGKMVLGGGAPSTAFIKIGADDFADLNARLVSQKRYLQVSVGNRNSAFTGANPLTAADVGADVTISIAAFTLQYGAFQVSYNSGSITGRAFSTTYHIFCDDATFAGGAVTYVSTTNFSDVVSAVGRVYVGSITTPADGGGGTGGGGGGGGEPCFTPETLVVTREGLQPIGDIEAGDEVASYGGVMRRVRRRLDHIYTGPLLPLRDGEVLEMVTLQHRFLQSGEWLKAREVLATLPVEYAGRLCNLEIEAEGENERSYLLACGRLAHNKVL